jgi:hypothetical protein
MTSQEARRTSDERERLREADRLILASHRETANDPLGIGPICDGCKEDWPCPFVQGFRLALRWRADYEQSLRPTLEWLGESPRLLE